MDDIADPLIVATPSPQKLPSILQSKNAKASEGNVEKPTNGTYVSGSGETRNQEIRL